MSAREIGLTHRTAVYMPNNAWVPQPNSSGAPSVALGQMAIQNASIQRFSPMLPIHWSYDNWSVPFQPTPCTWAAAFMDSLVLRNRSAWIG